MNRYVIESIAGTFWTGHKWTTAASEAMVYGRSEAEAAAISLRACGCSCWPRSAPQYAEQGFQDAIAGRESLVGVLFVVDPHIAYLYEAGYRAGKCQIQSA